MPATFGIVAVSIAGMARSCATKLSRNPVLYYMGGFWMPDQVRHDGLRIVLFRQFQKIMGL
ncbi:MAG: hypothetical protein C4531_08995 [Desulfurivibrio sp.]|nr:MAG: hypothetical protein C4531_08995 [Desulfurivibrio sp.]